LSAAYEAPRNEIEKMIADTWTELFGIQQIGIQDDFFELGGHSLLATQLASRLRESFDVSLGLDVIFEATTIARLADIVLEKMLESEQAAVAPILAELQTMSEDEVRKELSASSGAARVRRT